MTLRSIQQPESGTGKPERVQAAFIETCRLALLAVVLAAAACGGEETTNARPVDDEPKKDDAKAIVEPERLKNEAWDKLKIFYLGPEQEQTGGFVRSAVQTLRDPFESQERHYVPRVEVKLEDFAEKDPSYEEEKDPDAEEEVEVAEPVEPTTDTTKFRTQDYRLLVIRWGSSVNKAVVQDPEGVSYVITKDMPFGNRQGRVQEITEYEIFVQEPSTEEPVVLSIRPDLLKPRPDEQMTDRLFLNTGGAR